jgi:putative membrane protein
MEQLAYCGLPPIPGELLTRFNLDPVLIGALLSIAICHVAALKTRPARLCAAIGWLVAAAALLSPLCALSVSLFSARIAQHVVLLLLAAPLIALAWPRVYFRRRRRGRSHAAHRLWFAAAAFFGALWFWNMPRPYDGTLVSTPLYWFMHITLFGSGILLWRELLHHRPEQTVDVLTAGALTSLQMGLLGAVLMFAGHPLFFRHLTTTAVWGLTPLRDQQLGGVIMWTPGILLLLWAAVRSLLRLWSALEGAKAA